MGGPGRRHASAETPQLHRHIVRSQLYAVCYLSRKIVVLCVYSLRSLVIRLSPRAVRRRHHDFGGCEVLAASCLATQFFGFVESRLTYCFRVLSTSRRRSNTRSRSFGPSRALPDKSLLPTSSHKIYPESKAVGRLGASISYLDGPRVSWDFVSFLQISRVMVATRH
jgi:hypothetical protein